MKPASEYRPHSDGLASQVIGFFTNNPDEELTLDDIADKFGAVRGNLHTLLRKALDAGLLTRGFNDDSELVYRGAAAVVQQATVDAEQEPAADGVDIDEVAYRAEVKARAVKAAPEVT